MTTTPPPNDFDGPWKEALDTYLPEILAFLFLKVHAGIDRTRQYEPLDKELQQVAPGDGAGQAVDKLVRVYQQDGQEAWVLVHIEVQSRPDRHFAERMFRYRARLCDRFRRQIASLAILGDDRASWRPARFGYTLWGSRIELRFPTVKLLDYDLAILETNPNPRATVVLAHRLAQATRRGAGGRAAAKLALARRLYAQGHSREEIIRLYRFIDWLLRLLEAPEATTWQQIRAFEEEQQMAYITTAERIGRTLGLREAIAITLTTRFGAASEPLLPALQQLHDPDTLHTLFNRILGSATLDEARAAIDEASQMTE
jgi:hypothetical protein